MVLGNLATTWMKIKLDPHLPLGTEVNSRSIKDQYPKAETMGLIEVGVGDYLSDLAE